MRQWAPGSILSQGSYVTQRLMLAELIAILCILALHLWKNNILLSIGGGTHLYAAVRNFFI